MGHSDKYVPYSKEPFLVEMTLLIMLLSNKNVLSALALKWEN